MNESIHTLSSATSSDSEMESLASRPSVSRRLTRYKSLFNISSSGVSVLDIRNLTSSYQKLLAQATKEITKLNLEKSRLEKENEKLLERNVAMAEETKSLIVEKKNWEMLKQEVLEANEELAEEVDKLYKSEDKMLKEMKSLKQNLNRSCQDTCDDKMSKSIVMEKLLQENEKIKVENDLLTKTQKKSVEKLLLAEDEMERLRRELEMEKENVVKITKWKDALVDFFSAD